MVAAEIQVDLAQGHGAIRQLMQGVSLNSSRLALNLS